MYGIIVLFRVDYLYFHDNGSKSTIDAFGCFDDSIFNSAGFTNPETSKLKLKHGASSSETYQIFGSGYSNDNRAHGRQNVHFVPYDSDRPNDPNRSKNTFSKDVSPTSYSSNFYIRLKKRGFGPYSDISMAGMSKSGDFVNFNGGKATFDGTLSSVLGSNNFRFVLSVGPDNNRKIVKFSTDNPFNSDPAIPKNLSATADDSAKSVTLTWDNSCTHSSVPITSYQYQMEKDGQQGEWQDMTGSIGADTSYTVTGLNQGSNFKFKIRAMNRPGNNPRSSGDSSVATAALDNPPDLRGATVATQTYVKDIAITPLQLPEAFGDGPMTYSMVTLPPGLAINSTTRQITGTPTDESRAVSYTYRVVDGDTNTANSDAATLTINIAVVADTAPAFGSGATITAKDYLQNDEIRQFTLPVASGGNGNLEYSISPNLPAGLEFVEASRLIRGTPTGHQAATTYTYKVEDSDGNRTDSDAATLTFDITVQQDRSPNFGSAKILNQVFVKDHMIDPPLALPVATGGNGTLTYSISPTLPERLNFTSPSASERQIAGTPTRIHPQTTYTYKVADDDGDEATLTFDITVEEDTQPGFGSQTIDPQTYWNRATINTLLPAATGGNGVLTYSISGADLPAGLSFSSATRRITGTIEESVTQPETTYTYKVEDVDGDTAMLDLKITVTDPPEAVSNAIKDSMDKNMSEVARVIGGETMTGIRTRVQNYRAPTVGGNSSLSVRDVGTLSSDIWQEPVRMDADEFVRSDQFLSLVNAYTEGGLGRDAFSVWGHTSHNRFDGDDASLSYDGEVTGYSFGLDAPLEEGVIGGVTLSRFSSKADYRTSDGVTGTQKFKATTVNPYFGLRSSDYVFWSFIGIGSGDFDLNQSNYANSSDMSLNTVGVGVSSEVWRDDKTTLNLTGDFALTEMSVDAVDLISATDVSVHRTRLVFEASQRHQSSDGGVFEPSAEVGVVHDSGDGITGTRLEVGAGLDYLTPSKRMTLSVSSYGLLKRNNSGEWGIQGSIHMSPQAGDRGLSFSVRPSYGAPVRGVDGIWDNGRSGEVVGDDDYQPRMEADLSYGVSLADGQALLMPFSEMSMADGDQAYRVGTRLRYGSNLELNLARERAGSADDAEYSIRLQGGIRF